MSVTRRQGQRSRYYTLRMGCGERLGLSLSLPMRSATRFASTADTASKTTKGVRQ